MPRGNPEAWMWSEAVEMLARAERMHRQFFQPQDSRAPRQTAHWEPPVDVLETDEQVLILVALPGVHPEAVEAAIEGDALLIAGERVLPPELRTAVIHRLELPQGRFARRVPLPPGRYATVSRASGNGYLVITLQKT